MWKTLMVLHAITRIGISKNFVKSQYRSTFLLSRRRWRAHTRLTLTFCRKSAASQPPSFQCLVSLVPSISLSRTRWTSSLSCSACASTVIKITQGQKSQRRTWKVIRANNNLSLKLWLQARRSKRESVSTSKCRWQTSRSCASSSCKLAFTKCAVNKSSPRVKGRSMTWKKNKLKLAQISMGSRSSSRWIRSAVSR